MTLEEAKELYMKYNCSLFAMAREDMPNYTLYRELNIDRKLEKKWTKEAIAELLKDFEKSREARLFNRMYDLSIEIHDTKRLHLMMSLIDKVNIEDEETALCIAETIMSREIVSVRGGMIFWAYDSGLRDEAVILIKKVISLIGIGVNDEENKNRAFRDCQRLGSVIDALGFTAESREESIRECVQIFEDFSRLHWPDQFPKANDGEALKEAKKEEGFFVKVKKLFQK